MSEEFVKKELPGGPRWLDQNRVVHEVPPCYGSFSLMNWKKCFKCPETKPCLTRNNDIWNRDKLEPGLLQTKVTELIWLIHKVDIATTPEARQTAEKHLEQWIDKNSRLARQVLEEKYRKE